ncbi:MAG: endonuclease III domain-containing protein [Thermomicrobiales bacterium]
MLSQHTLDTNTARAFKSLKASFDTWDAMRTAPVSDVEDAIRPGGLAAVKAPRIHNILHEIHSSQTTLDLEQLRSMSLEDARGWLLGLHGVGPKTAACVLLFSLGKPALPVDTHVHRASRRLGIIGPKVSANAAHGALEVALGDDRDRVYAFHMNAITHGRTICKARTPLCDQCFLRDRCPYVDQCVHNA